MPFRDSSFPFHFILPWKFRNQGIIKRWKCSFRASFQNIDINPLCWRRFVFFIMHRMKRIKSFHSLAGLVSWKFLVPICRFGWYALGKSRLRSLCFVSVAIGSSKIFYITVWSDDSAFSSFIVHSTSSSVVKSALRAFFEAIMQTFCQFLICCSRSVCAAANAKNLFRTRSWGVRHYRRIHSREEMSACVYFFALVDYAGRETWSLRKCTHFDPDSTTYRHIWLVKSTCMSRQVFRNVLEVF